MHQRAEVRTLAGVQCRGLQQRPDLRVVLAGEIDQEKPQRDPDRRIRRDGQRLGGQPVRLADHAGGLGEPRRVEATAGRGAAVDRTVGGQLGEVGGDRRRAPVARHHRRLGQGGGQRLVRFRAGEREVAGPFDRIVDRRGQRFVCLYAVRGARVGIDHFAQQRMREPHRAVAADGRHAGVERRPGCR